MGGWVEAMRGTPRRMAVWFVAVTALVLAWGASSAVADTTVIGEQSLVSNVPNLDQIGQSIPVFQGDAGAGYVLSSPTVGTITSWSFLSGGAATGSQFALAVLAPTDQTGQGWRLLATSAPVAVTTATGSDAVNGPFAVDIPIDVGERIALMPTDGSSTPIETGAQNADGIRYFSQPFSGGLGSSQQIASGSTADNGQVVPIQATVAFLGGPVAPRNTQLPSISGVARQFETLEGDPGLWQNGVTRFGYRWLRCSPAGSSCVAVPGAFSASYSLTRDDVGFTLRVQVIAGNEGGDSAPAVSAPTAVVERGVTTARLLVSPNPSCTGIPTTFDGSGSVSPDGIKSYSFSVIDLYAADLATLRRLGLPQPTTERVAEFQISIIEDDLLLPPDLASPFTGNSAASVEQFAGPPFVSHLASAVYTFDWNRGVIYNPDDPQNRTDRAALPGVLVRDPVGVLLVVTDFAGHTAQAVAVLKFAQQWSTDSRNGCPKPRRPLRFVGPNAVLAARVTFPKGSSQLSTTASCSTRVVCVGSITVVARGLRAPDCNPCVTRAARRQLPVLATGFFSIPPHHNRKVVLKLTKVGKRRLHRGAAVRVRIKIASTSPTGRTLEHIYSQVLKR